MKNQLTFFNLIAGNSKDLIYSLFRTDFIKLI